MYIVGNRDMDKADISESKWESDISESKADSVTFLESVDIRFIKLAPISFGFLVK